LTGLSPRSAREDHGIGAHHHRRRGQRTAYRPKRADRLIAEKARLLAGKLTVLWPVANTEIDYRWAGTFDTTNDGLPLIGPVPGMKGVYAAYGYGGNGITFSFLAAQLIGNLIAGSSSPLISDFGLDRGRDTATEPIIDFSPKLTPR
jgi:glycine/D-amino acid oxidase-like deaminating enzyme